MQADSSKKVTASAVTTKASAAAAKLLTSRVTVQVVLPRFHFSGKRVNQELATFILYSLIWLLT